MDMVFRTLDILDGFTQGYGLVFRTFGLFWFFGFLDVGFSDFWTFGFSIGLWIKVNLFCLPA